MTSGYFWSFAASLSFAGYLVVGKISENELEPIALVFYLSLLAFLMGLPFVWINKVTINNYSLKREISNAGLWLHVICVFLAMWTFWEGVSYLNPATAVMIGRTETLWTVLLACMVYKEKFSPVYVLAFILMLLGLIVINGNLNDLSAISTASGSGIVYILLSSVFFAVAEILAKKVSRDIPPVRFTVYRNGIITIIACVVSILLGQIHWLERGQWLNVTLAALLGPCLARLFYLQSLQKLELVKVTLIGEFEPVFTALVSFLVLKEIPGLEEWTGGALIVAACLLLIVNSHLVEWLKPSCSRQVETNKNSIK